MRKIIATTYIKAPSSPKNKGNAYSGEEKIDADNQKSYRTNSGGSENKEFYGINETKAGVNAGRAEIYPNLEHLAGQHAYPQALILRPNVSLADDSDSGSDSGSGTGPDPKLTTSIPTPRIRKLVRQALPVAESVHDVEQAVWKQLFGKKHDSASIYHFEACKYYAEGIALNKWLWEHPHWGALRDFIFPFSRDMNNTPLTEAYIKKRCPFFDPKGFSVNIVGAGPSGLLMARTLQIMGFRLAIAEKRKEKNWGTRWGSLSTKPFQFASQLIDLSTFDRLGGSRHEQTDKHSPQALRAPTYVYERTLKLLLETNSPPVNIEFDYNRSPHSEFVDTIIATGSHSEELYPSGTQKMSNEQLTTYGQTYYTFTPLKNHPKHRPKSIKKDDNYSFGPDVFNRRQQIMLTSPKSSSSPANTSPVLFTYGLLASSVKCDDDDIVVTPFHIRNSLSRQNKTHTFIMGDAAAQSHYVGGHGQTKSCWEAYHYSRFLLAKAVSKTLASELNNPNDHEEFMTLLTNYYQLLFNQMNLRFYILCKIDALYLQEKRRMWKNSNRDVML